MKAGTEPAGSSAFMNSSGTTFKNDRTCDFVKSTSLPDRGEQSAPSESAVSAGIESVATHNRLLENDC